METAEAIANRVRHVLLLIVLGLVLGFAIVTEGFYILGGAL